MQPQRTGGMTAIGVLNIVFGSLGTLGSLLVVLGGGLLAAGGAAGDFTGTEAEGMETAMAAGGAVVAIIGVVSLAACVTLLVSGIGVLKLAPWGRTLSIVCGVAIVLMNLASVAMGTLDVGTIVGLAYGGLLLALFMKPDWKAAFSGMPVAGEISSEENFRAAA